MLFDIDGTLVDSVDLHARAWQTALVHFGKPVSLAPVRAQIGKGGDQLLPVFLTPDELARFGEAIDAFRSLYYRTVLLPQVRPFPFVRELFLELRERDVRIALASSAKGDELGHYLVVTQVGDLIESATTADDAERSKPHPDIFLAALDTLKLPAGPGVVVVGDSPYDIVAARRAGLDAIGVRGGGFDDATLREAGAVELRDGPADLLARLDETALARTVRGPPVRAPRPTPDRPGSRR